ncbi:MAG TPA: response regulator transcription factor [Vicinamibacteria bacterium]|nr:response regulator transcription factor [Vicinamibacteria bacterium]
MIRVLVVDDHAVVREGLKRIIEAAEDVTVADEAACPEQALASVAARRCDVVVLDLSLPGLGGMDLLRGIRRIAPRLPVLILSIHGEDMFALRALRAGAQAYLTKDSAPDELLAALRKVAGGGHYLTPVVAERLACHLDPTASDVLHDRLSERELQVLTLIGRGKTPAQMAAELNLSPKTIGTYRSRLLEKMGLRTSSELVAYAVRHDLVD